MFEKIMKCERCRLCQYQEPLLDKTKDCKVFWVGLSAKRVMFEDERPLSPLTNSGRILCNVEKRCSDVNMYRTNLVKCLPLDESGKLRYPNREEIELCLPNFHLEIKELSPQIIFLLGSKVIDAVCSSYSISYGKWEGFNYTFMKYENMYFVPVHHPSYVYVYKRKRIDEYISGLEQMILCIL